MNSFLDFINQDIEAKKTLLSSMPTNNKTNKRKYNDKIDSIKETYLDYKESVSKNCSSVSLGKPTIISVVTVQSGIFSLIISNNFK